MKALRISTDTRELDVALIHRFLCEDSHWAKGISMSAVRRSLAHSLCFGGFLAKSQVAFGRVVTDFTRFGYVMDVFVLPEHRGYGYGKALVQAILEHPELQTVTLLLRTSDAAALYERFGFVPLAEPDRYLRRAASMPQIEPESENVL